MPNTSGSPRSVPRSPSCWPCRVPTTSSCRWCSAGTWRRRLTWADMYLLDTNVVSELRKVSAGKADARVASWADTVDAADLYLSVITLQELEIGVSIVERRDPAQGGRLRAWLDGRVLPAFAGRILPIDEAVARRSARLHVP